MELGRFKQVLLYSGQMDIIISRVACSIELTRKLVSAHPVTVVTCPRYAHVVHAVLYY